jgi:putative salt-induced outer membrane protein
MLRLIFLIISLVSFHVSAEFSSEDSLSLVQTGGNTNVKTYLAASKNAYTLGKNIFKLNGKYTYGEAYDVRNAERWDALLRYDRDLTEIYGVYVSEEVIANRFAGIKRRFNTDVGGKYTLYKTEKNKTYAELGYRYTVEKKEDETQADDKDSQGRVFVQTDHKVKKDITARFWVEYIPNFTENSNYLINMEPSAQVALTSIFSLKIAYLWNYDNLPVPGNSKYDYTYTTSLLAKF